MRAGSPVPVLVMPLTPPQAVGDVVTGMAPVASGACSWRRWRPAWYSSARGGGGVGVALAVDAVVGRREDVVDLSERACFCNSFSGENLENSPNKVLEIEIELF